MLCLWALVFSHSENCTTFILYRPLRMQNANRVARNTVIQYLRLVINLVVALFSVRLIFNSLGPDDYGIYDVVAGVIAFMGFIDASLSQTSIRFLSVSLGEANKEKIVATFNSCFWLHFGIATITVIILETVSFFLFDGFLNIHTSRIYAAKIIYQCMCVTTFLHIVSTPFHALITSHEKFIFASAVSILDSILKLLIAVLLVYITYDKLIIYGVLMAGIAIVNLLVYIFYIKIRYQHEIRLSKPNIQGIKKQTSFACWTLCDVLGSVFNRQGYSIMLNKFFGTNTNAVFAISRQIEGQVYGVSAAVIDTMKPQIMKSYGTGDKERMFRLSMTAGKFGFILMSFVCIPLLVMMPTVLRIWLGNVPEGTTLFARLMVIACMSEQITRGLVYANQATGNIKWFSVIVSSIRALALPTSIIVALCGLPASATIVIYVIFEVIGSVSRILIVSKTNNLKSFVLIKEISLQIIFPFLLTGLLYYILSLYINSLLCIFTIALAVVYIVYCLLIYYLGLSEIEKNIIMCMIKKLLRKHD